MNVDTSYYVNMSSSLHRLTVRQIETVKKPGRLADGGGLYLRITAAGTKSWVYRTVARGKQAEVALGLSTALTLAAARQRAAEIRQELAAGKSLRDAAGIDGVTADTSASKPDDAGDLTFGAFAETYIASVEAGWRNPVHRQQWRQSLRDHAALLTPKPVRDINTDDVEAVLRPIWLTKAETAKRVRGRIEKVLDAAKAKGLRSRESTNPAAWRGHLAVLLPSQNDVHRGHHAALPWEQAPAFWSQLRAREALAARCLEFVILTAARSGEALGATWGEIDLDAKLWTIPKHRMKARREHAVPLSEAAVALLRGLRSAKPQPDQRVFSVAGVTRSNMAMAMLLRRMDRGDLTTHGFRSTFRDWAGDETEFSNELIELALAHGIKDKAEAAYRRRTAISKRRELMEAWATFLGTYDEPQ
jgi:integrase